MNRQATTTFEIRAWDETPRDEAEDGSKLTFATVAKAYEGELDGEGVVEQLAAYLPDGSATFTAFERFRGRLGDRAGSFVMRHEGTFAGGAVDSTWTVVPGSATGDLRGLRGRVKFAAQHAPRYEIVFEYGFE